MRSQLTWKYQVFVQYRDIAEEVIHHITQTCEGNPLMVMSYFHALLTKGYLEVKEDTVVATRKL